MYQILLAFHMVIAVLLIALIMLQQGKGAQTGAAFGSGASTTVFGSQGSGNFLTRTTAVLATLFFIVNLSLVALANRYSHVDPLDTLNVLTPSKEVGDVTGSPTNAQPVTQQTAPKADGASSSIPE